MSVGETSLRALFEHALALADDARQTWLAQLRVHQPEAAAQLERMLTLDQRQADPLGPSIASLKRTLDFDANAWLGRELAGFRLIRLLGEGGMGAVFLAQRSGPNFHQLTALKLLRGHWLDDRALARFADEARILARLHHPNIATFIDAGLSDDGRPYLVMEYIDGAPLLRFCNDARLSVFDRLQRVRGLLSALAYAHGALVVHRDLKPGNVLVTPDGTPKLLDFGIARLTDDNATSGATLTRPLTPQYASPEQLAGEPTGTASDIYSLGLLLYQLCVGVLPWDAGERSRTGTVPPPPATRLNQLDAAQRHALAAQRGSDVRQLMRNLRGDLGRILIRCLAVDPRQRYASVEALERDLDALHARRPPPGIHTSAAARAASFARRHIWPLALATLLLVAGAVVLVQALRSEHRLQIERDRAVNAAALARTEGAKSRQIADFVETMLSSIDPDLAHGMDRRLMELVLQSAGQRAQKQLAAQPTVRMAIERIIARSYNTIGQYGLAIQYYDAALAAAKQTDSGAAARTQLLTGKARSLANQGHSRQAMATIHAAMKTSASLPADSRARLFAQSNLAGFECDNGTFLACHDALAKIVPRQQRALGADDAQTMESLRELASAQTQLGHLDAARTTYRKLLASDRTVYGDADSRTLSDINGLAINYLQAKQFKQAEELLTPAVKLAEQTFGDEHPLTIGMLSNLGGAIRQQPGRNAQAKPYYEKVLAATKAHFGLDNRRTLVMEINLAMLLRDAGDLAQAEHHARVAIAHMDRALPAGSMLRGIFLDTLGSILTDEKKFTQAEQVLNKAHAIIAKANGQGAASGPMQTLVKHDVALYTAWGKPTRAAHWRTQLTVSPAATATTH